MSERFRGYREAMADAGVEVDPTLIRHDLKDAEDASGVVSALLEGADPPTAAFCANNRMSVGAVGAVGENRYRVAMVGFDDLELADALAMPTALIERGSGEISPA